MTQSSPFSRIAPLPFRAVRKVHENWCSEDCVADITESLMALQEINSKRDLNRQLVVVSICHDRFSAQCIAVRRVIEQLKHDDPMLELVIDVPCLCHLLNNTSTGALSRCEPLQSCVTGVEQMAVLLRKTDAVAAIGKKCPMPPKIMWLYIYDVLSFVIRNGMRIMSALRRRRRRLYCRIVWICVVFWLR